MARVTVRLRYADLNQPQTITAPTKLLPCGGFQMKIASDLETIKAGTGSGRSSSARRRQLHLK